MKKTLFAILCFLFIYAPIASADLVMPGDSRQNSNNGILNPYQAERYENFQIILFVSLAILVLVICIISYLFLKKIKKSYSKNDSQKPKSE
jgi:hypothetical protein